MKYAYIIIFILFFNNIVYAETETIEPTVEPTIEPSQIEITIEPEPTQIETTTQIIITSNKPIPTIKPTVRPTIKPTKKYTIKPTKKHIIEPNKTHKNVIIKSIESKEIITTSKVDKKIENKKTELKSKNPSEKSIISLNKIKLSNNELIYAILSLLIIIISNILLYKIFK